MSRRLLDTNVLVRYLRRDHEQQAGIATELVGAAERGEVELVILPEVLAECVFVLQSYYQRSRAEIAEVLARLISSSGFEIEAREVHLEALGRFGASRAHYVDCTLAATAAAEGVAVASFDRDLAGFGDVEVNLRP